MDEKSLELLVRIAAREQRYKCVETIMDKATMHDPCSQVQNTPCPDVADVLAKWRKAKKPAASFVAPAHCGSTDDIGRMATYTQVWPPVEEADESELRDL